MDLHLTLTLRFSVSGRVSLDVDNGGFPRPSSILKISSNFQPSAGLGAAFFTPHPPAKQVLVGGCGAGVTAEAKTEGGAVFWMQSQKKNYSLWVA